MRLLFASIHRDLDPSRDAAVATRGLLELLARRGLDCRVLPAGVLATLELPARRFQAELERGRSVDVNDLAVDRVRVTLMPTTFSRAERSPSARVGMFRAQEEARKV